MRTTQIGSIHILMHSAYMILIGEKNQNNKNEREDYFSDTFDRASLVSIKLLLDVFQNAIHHF